MSIQTIRMGPVKRLLIEAFCALGNMYRAPVSLGCFFSLPFLCQFYNKEKRRQNKDSSVKNRKIVYQYVSIFLFNYFFISLIYTHKASEGLTLILLCISQIFQHNILGHLRNNRTQITHCNKLWLASKRSAGRL